MRSYIMSWGTPDHGAIQLEVQDVGSFRQVYDLAETDAEIAGTVFEVDLWDVQLPMDRPLMVQFLLGHPARSRVPIHEDGVTHYASGRQLTDDHGTRYERPGGHFTAESRTMGITPTHARQIVADFVQTGRASRRAIWTEHPMD